MSIYALFYICLCMYLCEYVSMCIYIYICNSSRASISQGASLLVGEGAGGVAAQGRAQLPRLLPDVRGAAGPGTAIN